MNESRKLPDAYAKEKCSNLYKVMQLDDLLYADSKGALKSIDRSRDLQQAYGETLDKYGEMFGVERKGASDEQLRIKLLNKIAVNHSQSDCNSLISAIAGMLSIDVSEIKITEGDTEVVISGLTIKKLEESGYKSSEITSMIQDIITAGVELAKPVYAGSLLIVDTKPGGTSRYRTLLKAWIESQAMLKNYGQDVGLSGYGEVPSSWTTGFFPYKGEFQGGSLAIISGDDE